MEKTEYQFTENPYASIDAMAAPEAVKSVMKAEYVTFYKRECQLNPDIFGIPNLAEIIRRNQEAAKANSTTGPKSDWVMITVNPKPGVPLGEFAKKIFKSAQKSWITKGYYCFEQRHKPHSKDPSKNQNLGDGMHAHILLKRGDKRPSEIKREFMSTFKDMIGGEKSINIIFGPISHWDRVVAYVHGMKKGEPKQSRANDCIWRAQNNLQDIYVIDENEEDSENFLSKL